MTRLNLETRSLAKAHVHRPAYDPASLDIGVVHFGPGAFHRAHQAAYFDTIAQFDHRWGICGVSLHSSSVREALLPQEGLYTLAILDDETRYQILGSIREILVAHDDIEAVFERLVRPTVQIVTSTVTEKGYCLTVSGDLNFWHPDIAHDVEHPESPISFIGYVVEGLKRRRLLGVAPFILIPCDSLPNNGTRLKAAVIAFARRLDKELALWIDAHLACPNTMVDSITPATDEALIDLVRDATGLEDQCPVQREAFTQWIIEKHDHADGPDWARSGVIITDNVPAFEQAKIRLLNGPHSALAYLGLHKGYQTVAEAMEDPKLSSLVRDLMLKDIAPLLEAPEGLDLVKYAEAILKRFRNPAIKHFLSQIAWDGSQKLPIRLLSSMIEGYQRGADIHRFAIPIAAWMRFIRQKAIKGEELMDPLAKKLVAAGLDMCDEVSDVYKLLKFREVFSPEISNQVSITKKISDEYYDLLKHEELKSAPNSASSHGLWLV